MTMIIALPGNEELSKNISHALSVPLVSATFRHFPDGETYLKIESNCKGQDLIVVGTLRYPNEQILPLIFLSETLRDLAARRIGLVAPYLAYMRQDKRFHPGEAVTSRIFAKLLSKHVDWLITIDPHLHRYKSLNEIYPIPNQAISASPLVSQWIQENVKKPVLIGPDRESEQWVSEVAAGAEAPFVVLDKIRHGDREVEVTIPQVERWRDYTPVLVDDIISTGRTMIETMVHLKKLKISPPVCIGIHALFSDQDYQALLQAGAARVVTTNTIPHASNDIDVSGLLAESVRAFEPSFGRTALNQ